MEYLTVEVFYNPTDGKFHTVNGGKAYCVAAGVSIVDDVISQALAVVPRVHDGSFLYVPGPMLSPVISFIFYYDVLVGTDNVMVCRCYQSGILGVGSDRDMSWRLLDEMDLYLRGVVSAVEQEILIGILSYRLDCG